jgi:hypothetical protein
MDFRWMAAACAAMIVGGASAQDAVQWRVEDGGNGHWYSLRLRGALTWSQLNAATVATGGHLATMTSPAERNFLISVMAGNTAAIGGVQTVTGPQDEPGIGWGWCTGEPMTWTNWASWEPSNIDSYLGAQENITGCFADGRWVDLADHLIWTQHYLVEWSADCNSDGIVDYGQIRDGSLPDYNGNNIPDCCEAGSPCAVGSYPVQWRVEDGGNGHWYEMRDFGTLSWMLHRDAAVALGGHLAAITSAAENAHVERLIPQTIPGYGQNYIFGPTIGLFQSPGAAEPDGGWSWVTGEALGFTDWFPTEPNNFPNGENWVRFRFQGGTLAWNDVFESMTPGDLCCNPFVTRAIVEWSADCNGDGIVDYGQILTGQLADTNANGIPDTCEVDPCPGDVTDNGVVNGTDLAAILAAWGSDGSSKFDCDIDNDGVVGGGDLAFVLAGWGACP